ncbi:MAG: 50S ribosomal protein L6 [Patescibacteria group bacterium]
MSRIGKQPVPIPSGVQMDIKDQTITLKGPKGSLTLNFHPRIKVKIDGQNVLVERSGDENLDRGLHGLTRTLISNAITGVAKGFSKQLDIQGVGYRVQLQGKNLELALGYSHPIKFPAPDGIAFEIDKDKKNILTVLGIDKCLVGQVSADIRSLRPPEPYKGKGIRYLGEQIRRKAGKAATAAAKGS